MLSKGITDIVRIGGGSKNCRLNPFQLRNRQASGFDRVQNRQFAHLKGALEESQQSIDDVQRASRLNSKPEKMAVVAWLEDEDPEAFQELQVPADLGGTGDTVVGRKVGGTGGKVFTGGHDGAAFIAVSCQRIFTVCCLMQPKMAPRGRFAAGMLGRLYLYEQPNLLAMWCYTSVGCSVCLTKLRVAFQKLSRCQPLMFVLVQISSLKQVDFRCSDETLKCLASLRRPHTTAGLTRSRSAPLLPLHTA